MSIRLRLTLLYSAIVALTMIVFSGAVYALTSRVTMDAAQQTLVAEAQRLGDRPAADFDQLPPAGSSFAASQTYVQLRDPNGAVLGKTANLGSNVLPLSNSGLEVCQQGRGWLETASTDSGRLLVYSRPAVFRGQLIGIVQVGRSLADYDQSLNTLLRILAIGSIAATCITFGIGWLLASTALRPIQRITETAQAIGEERDFGRRVEYSGPKDEINSLAKTFNTMLSELQDTYRKIEEALQVQRRFVADASHELRTPLTTIRGNLGLLQRQPPISAEDHQAVVNDLVDETERLTRLVNDLLLLARADAKRPLRNEPVPIAALLDDVCRQVKLLAPERSITCTAPDEAAIAGDRDALKQVLLILLDNAVNYTPPRRPVEVEASLADGLVVIQVCDHGPGIPGPALAHIFERFYRADSARTSGGAGLGLAIAKALVEAQSGTIAAQSTVGQGSVFTIRLPRWPASGQETSAQVQHQLAL